MQPLAVADARLSEGLVTVENYVVLGLERRVAALVSEGVSGCAGRIPHRLGAPEFERPRIRLAGREHDHRQLSMAGTDLVRLHLDAQGHILSLQRAGASAAVRRGGDTKLRGRVILYRIGKA